MTIGLQDKTWIYLSNVLKKTYISEFPTDGVFTMNADIFVIVSDSEWVVS